MKQSPVGALRANSGNPLQPRPETFWRSNLTSRFAPPFDVRIAPVYLSRMTMRRHPNKRASRDHTPGPIMASAIHIAARRILFQGSLDLVTAAHNANAATTHPETGVHKPTDRSAPAIIGGTLMGCPASNPRSRKAKIALPATSLRIRRPAPGQPCAYVEKRRRKTIFTFSVPDYGYCHQASTGSVRHSLGPHSTPAASVDASHGIAEHAIFSEDLVHRLVSPANRPGRFQGLTIGEISPICALPN